MGGILDKLDEWLRGLLIEGITGNLSGMFDTVNTKVGEIAGEVGQTPLAWNSGVFSMIRNLSETVIVPIAGVILTFVMCYELIQLVTEKNNLHDVDTWMFFKWIFKTFCAVLIVTNTWNIVMGIFDVGQSVVNSSAGIIIGNTSIDISSVITDMEAQLEALGTGELFGLWFQSLFVGLTMNALRIRRKSPPSGNGWNREKRNVRRKTRCSPIRKSLRRNCKEVLICHITITTRIIPLPPLSPILGSTMGASLWTSE